MQLGTVNRLKINRITPPGAYLEDPFGNEVLLPKKYLLTDHIVDSEVNVFVFKDSENRIVSTTEKPYLYLGDFAYMEVVTVNPFGAFVDWGLDKDLFVPFREQLIPLEIGEKYLFTLCYDYETDRLYGSMKVKKILQACEEDLTGQEVEVFICESNKLGTDVIVNNRYLGLIFRNNQTRSLERGNYEKAFVRTVRPDGKLDIQFEPLTIERFDNAETQILERLATEKFMPLNDHSDPELIREELGMSKKMFKQTIGKLYKLKKITLEENGIRIVE